MSDNKPKNYYTLNLTEGRIFAIFVLFVILLVVIIFSVFIFLANNKNAVKNKIENDNTELVYNNTDNMSYHSELSGEENNGEKFVDLFEESEDTTEDLIATEDMSIIADDGTLKGEIDLDDLVTLDNTETLYSSKFKTKEETTTVAEVKKTPIPFKVKSTPVVKKHEPVNNSKRFIVQVGSYKSKKTAEDISIYYQMQGYPVYIKEKNVSGTHYYRLRVGPFKEKGRAETFLAALKESKYGKSSYISVVYL